MPKTMAGPFSGSRRLIPTLRFDNGHDLTPVAEMSRSQSDLRVRVDGVGISVVFSGKNKGSD